MNSCSVPGSQFFIVFQFQATPSWEAWETAAEVDYNHDGGLLATGGLKAGKIYQNADGRHGRSWSWHVKGAGC